MGDVRGNEGIEAERVYGLHKLRDWLRRLTPAYDMDAITEPLDGVRVRLSIGQNFGFARDPKGLIFFGGGGDVDWLPFVAFDQATFHVRENVLSFVTSPCAPLGESASAIPSVCVQFELSPEASPIILAATSIGFGVFDPQSNEVTRVNGIVGLFVDHGDGTVVPQ